MLTLTPRTKSISHVNFSGSHWARDGGVCSGKRRVKCVRGVREWVDSYYTLNKELHHTSMDYGYRGDLGMPNGAKTLVGCV